MQGQGIKNKMKVGRFSHAVVAAAAALLLFSATAAFADGSYTMAPPIEPGYDQSAPVPDSGNVSADSVFNWTEVPQDQQVPIERAVFDQGGYQLYDSVGETIVVPFTDNNLYVMKFAVSPNDTMFFVNGGDAPVLYIPRDGYLENATVPGARWYPFSEDFHPAEPVFLGCAPSWSAFIGMGWYPGMICHGGFYCGVSYWDGGVFVPTVGLFFVIGGHPCYGWHGYDDYCYAHPGFYHTGWYHAPVYGWASHQNPYRAFSGGHPWSGGHSFGSGNHSWSNDGAGRSYGGSHSWSNGNSGGSHAFRGAGNWDGNRSSSIARSYSGGDRSFSGGDRSYGSDRGFGADRSYGESGRVFRSAGAAGSGSFGDRSFGGSDRSYGGDRSYGSDRSYSGADRSFGGGDRSFGGSQSWQGRSSGDRGFSGGDRSYSGGGGRSYDDRSSGGRDSGGDRGGSGGGGGGGHWGR